MYIFKSTSNTRPIIENSLKYIRSDVPTEITERERAWLLSNGITTVVDLRTDGERERKRCPLIDDCRFSYNVFTVSGGDVIPQSADCVSKSYISMVDARFDEMIEFLLNAKSNVLYFCNAGKDRTGVASAVLLYRLGMPYGYIVEDYMKSKANLQARLNEFAAKNPSIDPNIVIPQKRYIEEFLDWYIGRNKG